MIPKYVPPNPGEHGPTAEMHAALCREKYQGIVAEVKAGFAKKDPRTFSGDMVRHEVRKRWHAVCDVPFTDPTPPSPSPSDPVPVTVTTAAAVTSPTAVVEAPKDKPRRGPGRPPKVRPTL
jgi:hypothetical protein